MKKIAVVLLLFVSTQLFSYASEEVVLDVDDNLSVLEAAAVSLKSDETVDTNKSSYLLEEIFTKNFDEGPVESMHFFGYFRGGFDEDITFDDDDLGFDYNSINAGVNGKFRGGTTYYEARFRFNPQNNYSFMQYLPSNLYVANTSIPHHTIIFGNTRTPTGYEGGMSMTTLPFVGRSQIGRNFGNVRKVGLRVKGNYSLVEYDIGGYDSDTYFRSFFPGAEFTGWVNFKPLGKTDGRYGKLLLGGGLTAGHNDIDYCVTGLYAGYEYKKLMANFEWGAANGYNGAKTITSKHAEGFNTTLGYKITPKIQLVGRYDHYVPDKTLADDIRREYSAGLNYFIKGQALKIMLNYVFCQNDLRDDSHRILLGTQILL